MDTLMSSREELKRLQPWQSGALAGQKQVPSRPAMLFSPRDEEGLPRAVKIYVCITFCSPRLASCLTS